MGAYFLYILALEDEKYYVGISRDVYSRYKEHESRKGAHFTKIHHPIGLICSRELNTWHKDEAEEEETNMTLLMMTAFGIENVRGGDYYQANIYDVKNCMGDDLYNSINQKHKYADTEKLFKQYPEIKYGLDLLSNKIDFPVNISSYHLWPTKNYYDKAISKISKNSETVDLMVAYFMELILDSETSLEEKTRYIKEMVNSAVKEQGFLYLTISDENGEEHNYYIDKIID